MLNPNVSTLHIQVLEGGITKTILLPSDSLRTKYTADSFLGDVKQLNAIRNVSGYTGTYRGRRILVMGTSMGCPSTGIYSHELIHFYRCKNLIRMGTAGAPGEKLRARNMVFVMDACTTSNYVHLFGPSGDYSYITSYELLLKAVEEAKAKGLTYHVGNVLSSGVLYGPTKFITGGMVRSGMEVLAVEMEAAALYSNAAVVGVDALCIVTISNSVATGEAIAAEGRQTMFTSIMEVVLSLA